MTIEEMKERKRELGYSYRELAEKSGVPVGTIQKIFGNVTRSPRRETILALEKVLAREGDRYEHAAKASKRQPWSGAGVVKDAQFLYRATLPKGAPEKKQGEYTLDDYYALPEDQRAELIDGVLYDMSSPTGVHQVISLQVAHQFLFCMEGHEDCEVFIAPMDVQLDCDNRTMVEPDVIVLCDLDKHINRCIFGAPDFVMEVLSPSTRRRDVLIKLNKYWNAGCKEYWIVDPDDQSVMVYFFEKDELAVRYTFDDEIPVRISDGKCSIDFRKIKARLARLDRRD